MKTIALFGGSFDPPHIGHIAIVKALSNLDEIDKVVVLPTFLNPFKEKSFLKASKRFELLKELFLNDKDVEISDYEVKQEQKVTSIKSVKHFLKKYKKIYFVIGADNLKTLKKWQNYEELKELVTFIIASRDAIVIPRKYITLNIDENISSSELRIQNKRNNLNNRIEQITNSLDKHKAEGIEVFDLRDKNYFVDYAIIASSLGTRHTPALLNHLKDDIKPAEKFNNVDESGDWIVIDLGDILIHIMTPEYRVKYDMESFLSSLKEGKEGAEL
ncbi:nicotinate (nicotinamide) nucleotide adenylyltransferase [Sulfurimonas sp.]|uniref:nicotinate (nicotinamide) nucleotide adenylyltransferase n=1 Tax=Sulfurimonas sp. TaxID=2022749 RepID=UPI002AB26B82|nr:nicotinate (nicotinamide) nucleotide adenylyltransferase [Sulfurimonas sp.]